MNSQKFDLLLHVCCAPCALLPLELLTDSGRNVCVFYHNPNIHPEEEYRHRRDTFAAYAEQIGVAYRESKYRPALWDDTVSAFGGPYPLIENASDYEANLTARRLRCAACYRLRFSAAAEQATMLGIASIATTLSISPYQFIDLINAELLAVAREHQLTAVQNDYRDFYPEAVSRARAAKLYRQNYCGCRFSEEEARLEREARKIQRKRLREARGSK
jgi:predicted adenine nucleotide alpha hydrolase (AANH) superfamily ATPase